MIRLQQLKGQRGRVKVGYHTAATLGRFTLMRDDTPGVWRIDAAVEQSDPFWISQGPLSLELEVGKQRWSWLQASIAVAEGALTGTVNGAPVRR